MVRQGWLLAIAIVFSALMGLVFVLFASTNVVSP
jgi:hypothetical protein